MQSGKELSGFLLGRMAPWLTRVTHSFNKQFVKKEEDAYMINCMIVHGVGVPLMFLGVAAIQMAWDRYVPIYTID